MLLHRNSPNKSGLGLVERDRERDFGINFWAIENIEIKNIKTNKIESIQIQRINLKSQIFLGSGEFVKWEIQNIHKTEGEGYDSSVEKCCCELQHTHTHIFGGCFGSLFEWTDGEQEKWKTRRE